MHTGKCWFEKGDFDHFWMCFGCFRAHFGLGGSLKQPQHVISDPGVPKTAPARQKSQKQFRPKRCVLENAGFKRVILTIFGCVLGVLGLILDPGGP